MGVTSSNSVLDVNGEHIQVHTVYFKLYMNFNYKLFLSWIVAAKRQQQSFKCLHINWTTSSLHSFSLSDNLQCAVYWVLGTGLVFAEYIFWLFFDFFLMFALRLHFHLLHLDARSNKYGRTKPIKNLLQTRFAYESLFIRCVHYDW